jgi:adenylate kinase
MTLKTKSHGAVDEKTVRQQEELRARGSGAPETDGINPGSRWFHPEEVPSIQTRPEFRDLIRPLSDEESAALESSIASDGVTDPVTLWRVNTDVGGEAGVVVDGHNRIRIATKLGIGLPAILRDFSGDLEAKAWIAERQLGRRNLHPLDRQPLVEVIEDFHRKSAKDRQRQAAIETNAKRKGETLGQSSSEADKGRALDKVASETGVSRPTYEALKQVNKSGTPELKDAVRQGKASASAAAEVAKLPEKDQRAIVKEGKKAVAAAAKKAREDAKLTEFVREIGIELEGEPKTEEEKRKFAGALEAMRPDHENWKRVRGFAKWMERVAMESRSYRENVIGGSTFGPMAEVVHRHADELRALVDQIKEQVK